MSNEEDARKRHALIKISDLEHRNAVLSALARVIASAHLSKTAAHKNRTTENTPAESRHHVNENV